MSLDDFDFDTAWEEFKKAIGTKEFYARRSYGSILSCFDITPQNDKPLISISFDVFAIYKGMGLIVEHTAVRPRQSSWHINPAELCSESTPSIHHDKEGLRK